MRRHVLELVGAILLWLAAFFSYAAWAAISLPLVGTGPWGAPTSDALAPALISIPKLGIRWPQFPNFCIGPLHKAGVPAMNYRLLLQSVVFVLEGLLLVLLLSSALYFEAARLVLGIAVAVFCLIVELFVAVRVARRLWNWSGQLARLMIRENPGTPVSTATAAGSGGEA